MKMREAFSLFVVEKEVAGVYSSTIETYTAIVDKIFIETIGDIDVMDLTLLMLQNFIIVLRNKRSHGKSLSPNTIKSYWRHIKSFLRYLYASDFIERDIASKIPSMRGYKKIKEIYFDDEIQLIFTNIVGNSVTALQKRSVFALLLDTGMRQAELTRVEIDDLNIQHRFIIVRGDKGHEDRRVPVSVATIRIINRYLQKRQIPFNDSNQNLMFVNRYNKGITARTIERYIDTNVKALGITKGNTHLFRHTYITRKCLETKDAFYVQLLAGHKDLSTTKGYYQIASSYQVAHVDLIPISQLLATIKI